MKRPSRTGLHCREFAQYVAPFQDAGLVDVAAIHSVDILAAAAGVQDPRVLLGLALAVQAPETGSAGVDLGRVRQDAFVERALDDGTVALALDQLDWPEPGQWLQDVQACTALVGKPEDGDSHPFLVDAPLVMTRRQWRYQERLARHLLERASVDPQPPGAAECQELAAHFPRWFAGPDGGTWTPQRLGAATALFTRVTVITGGPGTGKTHTVARLILALRAQHRARRGRDPRVALAAPTGKAAVRMREALREATHLQEPEHTWLKSLKTSTLHRMLGANPARLDGFAHHAGNPVDADVVVVDEASMIDLAMMCRLLDAVRPDARVVLLGDPHQLASVEAGCVLADLAAGIGHAFRGRSPHLHQRLTQVDPAGLASVPVDCGSSGLVDCMVHFEKAYRFKEGSPLQKLAQDIAAGTPESFAAAVARLEARKDGLNIIPHHGAKLNDTAANKFINHAYSVWAALAEGGEDATAAALAALAAFRVLTPHRAGPFGVAALNQVVVEGLRKKVKELHPSSPQRVGETQEMWPGRPVLVTRNSPDVELVNGDVGVVVRGPGKTLRVAFPVPGEKTVRFVDPARLPPHETCFAMTVHKSQGSQFHEVALVLPERRTPLVTRELVYTGLTRAKDVFWLVGSTAVFREALGAPTRRASTLGKRLWGA